MGFVDVGTWQPSGAKVDFFRGTWQKVKQKHCGTSHVIPRKLSFHHHGLHAATPGGKSSYNKSSKVCDPVLLPRRRFSMDRAEILQAGAGRDRERLHDLKFLKNPKGLPW